MKKMLYGLLAIGVLGVLAYLTAAEYRYELYQAAVAYERQQARLGVGQVDWEGVSMAYLETQPDKAPVAESRETVILIHGFTANKDNWLRFAAHVDPRFHVIAPDMMGHGDSSQDPQLAYGIFDQVAYLRRFAELKGLKRFHLVGNSMGGTIAALYSIIYPQQVTSLLLMNPAGIREHKTALDAGADAATGNNPLVLGAVEDMDTLMDFVMEKKPFIPWPIGQVAAELQVQRQGLYQQIFQQIYFQSPEVDFQQQLRLIQAPTLVMWGLKDRVLHPDNAQIFTQLIPNAESLMLEGVGHLPMLEIPRQSAAQFNQFVAAQP